MKGQNPRLPVKRASGTIISYGCNFGVDARDSSSQGLAGPTITPNDRTGIGYQVTKQCTLDVSTSRQVIPFDK